MATTKQILSIKGHQHNVDTSIPPDFCIKLKEESIPVHKEVLTSASHYFHCLFESGMQEVQNQALILHDFDPHHDLNPHVVKTVLEYMRGNDITIEWDDVTDYLDIVESWQITELKDLLEDYIVSNISVDNCMNWSCTAQRYYMKDVQARIEEVMSSNFARVTAGSDFLSLPLSAVKDLLTNGMMMNVSSDEKLHVCINWILVNEADRKYYCKDLLDHTGLLKCSHGFLELVVRSYVKNLSENDCQSAKPYTSWLLAWTFVPGADKQKTVIAVGDKAYKHLNNNILQFDFDRNTIKEIGSLPGIFAGDYPARCSTPYGMFSGGFSVCEGSVICTLLDVPSMAYLRLPDLPVAAYSAGATFVNDKVYVLGGYHTTNLMHRLDLQTLQWSRCANLSLPQPSDWAVAVVCSIGTMIYVRGRIFFELLTYSTTNDVWSVENVLPPCLKYKAENTVAVPTGSDIYFFTPSIHLNRCARYDTNLKQWMELAAFPARHDICAAACIDNKIILCGALPRIDIFDLLCNEWEESPLKMPQKLQNIFVMTL